MSNLRTFSVSQKESRIDSTGDERPNPVPRGSWTSVLYLTRREAWKNRRSHLVAVTVALVLGIAAAYMFGAISDSPSSGSPAATVLNLVFLICVAVQPRTGAWPSEELSTGKGLSSEGHVAFLKTLPLTFGQIVAARALVTVFSVLVLLPVFLGSFYALSEPFRDELGVGGLLLFASFWIGFSLAFEAVGLFTELGNLRGMAGFYVYLVLITLLGGVVGGYGANGVNVVTWAVEITQSHVAVPGLVLLLGGVLLALSWIATTRRLNKRGVCS